MRKSRTVVKEVEIEVADQIGLNPNTLFGQLEKYEIAVPTWATMLFVFARSDRKILDVSFFEDTKDFFLWYSKVLIRRVKDVKAASYSKDVTNEWKLFLPPTLIGVNLRTKMRF
jgi:hypothetical protein